MLGSRCPCWVQGGRVGFEASVLGSRHSRWVVRIGFEASMLGLRHPHWVLGGGERLMWPSLVVENNTWACLSQYSHVSFTSAHTRNS